jgi:pilus assembly protein Flp/PilA
MKTFSQSLKSFWTNEDGATAIEYGLLASLIALAIVGGATALGGSIDALFQRVSTTLGGTAAP